MKIIPYFRGLISVLWFAVAGYTFFVFSQPKLLMTADSGYYVTVAHSLATFQGFSHHGQYWTVFPPLYSLILSLFAFLHNPLQSAPILHALLFGLFILGIALQSSRHNESRPIISLTLPLLAFFSPVFGVASYMWTEILYLVITTFMLLLLCNPANKWSKIWLGLLVFVTSLAPVTRYIGVVNILVATLCLFFTFRGQWWKRFYKCAAFGGIALLPTLVWSLRNYSIDGSFFGTRPPSRTPLIQNLTNSAHVLTDWFSPVVDVWPSPLWLVVPALIYAVLAVPKSIPWRAIAFLFLFEITYLCALNISASRHLIDPIDTRLLIPIYPPLLCIFGLILNATLSGNNKISRALMITVFAVLVLNNFLSFGRMFYDLPQHRRDLICRLNYRPPPNINCSIL
jgi:hypothetical protein